MLPNWLRSYPPLAAKLADLAARVGCLMIGSSLEMQAVGRLK
jgi:hypothetical protein